MGLQADPVDPSVGIPKQGRQGGQRGDQAQREHGPARARLIHAAAAQADQQRQCVQARTQADGQGQAGVGHQRHQRHVHQLRQDQHADGDLDRRADVLLGIEARCQDLYRQQADQADRIGNDGQAGLQHVLGSEGAIVEQGGDKAVR
ncbi:hypothetical protein G6F35_013315 [Rhizopus arrhizus]|nr:hypothetical protein G6F35_013315 [Rhizopus arrhizus]